MGRYISPVDSRTVNDYNQDIQLGIMPGTAYSFISAETPLAQAGVTENIWPQGGRLQYLSADTTMYVSSSSAADTTQTVVQIGLNDNLEQIFGVATLNGQSQVALSSQFFRFYGFFNIGPTLTTAGDVYVAESDTLTGGVPDTASKIQIKMPAGRNLATNGTFTVPKDKLGYLFQIEGSIEKSKNATVLINTITEDGLEYLVSPYNLYESSFSFGVKSGLGAFGDGTVIEPLIISQDADTSATINFTVNLLDI